jgi:hypothetical protein
MGFGNLLIEVSILQLILWTLPLVQAAQYIPVPWSDKTYGPDGPWQAVKVTVGGTSEQILMISEEHQELDLMPGGDWNSKILTSAACEPYTDGTCGIGGTWDPEATTVVQQTGDWTDEASRISAPEQRVLTLGTTVSSFTQWNSSLVMIENVTVTAPDGRVRGPELGTLSLGGDEAAQKFATDQQFNAQPILGFSFPGAAYNKSQIKSFSYGLQIGAAAFGYSGSLIFGGYDKARLIGPYTSYSNDLSLLDISIGVETGGTPFDFEEKKGLLLSNTSQSTTLSVLPDPRAAYLNLPGKTCEEIAKHIPITFDTTTKYWLWNTKDKNYKTIVTSPAYLGFTFPPTPGSSANVTIKVPFSLLNLTLDAPITKVPTAYFPCQDYAPDDNVYILGRSFLQAAFLGRNWNRKVSWLAQAPGPGVTKNGLAGGQLGMDIEDADLDLKDIFDNSTLFGQTWAPYWTPLPKAQVSSPSPSSTASSSSSSVPASPAPAGLSMGAKIGIGLGAAAVFFLAIGVLVLYLRHRWQKQAAATYVPPLLNEGKPDAGQYELEQPPMEMHGGKTNWTYELPTRTPELGPMSPTSSTSEPSLPRHSQGLI